ncbi:MAG TPA: carboxypeptidase regulatory-like domain-containing protein [Thermoanaerobaculia bacterium]|nr:carboxypeptidase regulatory-like domain-containing protein [Thermoanaerobaculia bacterium]
MDPFGIWLFARLAFASWLAGTSGAIWFEVTPLTSPEPATLRVAVPGASGTVRLDNRASGLALVCIGGREVSVRCEQRYLHAQDSAELVRDRGVALKGAIAVDGRPTPSARISVVLEGLKSTRFVTLPLARDGETPPIRQVRSDRAGRFETPPLAPGRYLLEIVPPGGELFHSEPFRLPARETLLPRSASPGGKVAFDLGEFAFSSGMTVEIHATSTASGQPLAGAKVGGSQGELPRKRFFEQTTGRDGLARIAGLDPAMPASIACTAPGYMAFRQRFDTPPGVVDCELEPLAEVTGEIRDAEKKPLRGATASLQGTPQQARTRGDGRFALTDLPAGAYDLIAAAPGYRAMRLGVTVAAGEKRLLPAIDLERGHEIAGVVRDRRTKAPISEASVVSLDPPGLVATRSDANGEFRLTAADSPLRLAVSAAGYPERDFDVEEAVDGPLLVELTAGGRIHVTVWDDEGNPCRGCPVTIAPEAGTILGLETNAAGEGVSTELAEGVYRVARTRLENLGTVVSRQSGDEVRTVDLHAGETPSVIFGAEGTLVQVRFDPPVPAGWALTADSGAVQRVAERLEDGSFQLRQLPAGNVAFLHLADDRGTTISQGSLPSSARGAVRLELPQTAVSGVLTGATAGQRLQLVSLANPSVAGTTFTDSDGHFSVPFVTSGLYALVLEDRILRTVSVEGNAVLDLGRIER